MFLCTCKTRYEPSIITTNLNYLVVDGFLNNGNDSTFIRLSRTRKLDSSLLNSAEKNAVLTVEDTDGNSLYQFTELNQSGVYTVPSMALDLNNKYKLRIKTSDGKQYLTDELTVTYTPPIDSISWKKTDKGVTIYANTHNPQNNTKYYRWEYTETYEYHARFLSFLEYDTAALTPGTLKGRGDSALVYTCWTTKNSREFLLSSTAKLSDDVISDFALRSIDLNAVELSVKYSMLLKQYSLSAEAYQYMQNLKRITEQTGSIFDAQPAEIVGNIHCLENPAEPVLGFIGACNTDSRRIFITNEDVSPWLVDRSCPRILVNNDVVDIELYFHQFGYIPTQYYNSSPISPIWGALPECVDCRLSGGNTIKPDFW